MSPVRLPPLVLMCRQTRVAPAAERWVLVGAWVVIFTLLVGMFFLLLGGLFDSDPETVAKTLARLPEKFSEDPADFLGLVAVPMVAAAHLWYVRRANRLERVFLDDTGIRYQTALPNFLGSLRPSWSLQWSQLRELRIALPAAMIRPEFTFLEFDAGQVKGKLPQPLLWVPADATGQAALPQKFPKAQRFFTLSSYDREETLRLVEQSAIVRYAKQAGVKVGSGPARETGFALESNRHTAVAAILGIALLVYGLVDIALYEESYAVEPPLVLFAVAGAVVAFAGMLWLDLAGTPRAQTLALALLLGGGTGVALYSGLLRLNEATNSEGLRSYEYRLTRYSVFAPVDPRLPELDFSNYGNYWRQFKLGTTHSFELRKGGLGFYQVNMAPVRERMVAYFRGEK